MTYFYFSRYHITTDANYLNKAQFFSDGLDKQLSVEYRKDKYKFVDSEVLKVGSKIYVAGKLVKYKLEHTDQVINSNTNDLESITTQNKVLDSVRFIIDPESSIIAFEESKSHIPKGSFSERFIELFSQKYSKEFTDIVISPITIKYSFTDKLKSIKFIKKLVIELVPSNPNNSELWENVDERLRKNGITNYKEIQENKKKDQGLVIDAETESKIAMGVDGYGVNYASGIDEQGDTVKISTKDQDELEKIFVPNDKKSTEDLIREIQEKLNELISRTIPKH